MMPPLAFLVWLSTGTVIFTAEAFTIGIPRCGRQTLRSSSIVLHKIPMERPSPDTVFPEVEEEIPEEPPALVIPSNSLMEILRPPAECNVNQMGPTAMAYIGDIVYELLIRSKYIWPPKKTSDLQQKVIGYVRAEFQADLLGELVESFPITSKEENVISRGRNSKTQSRNRRNLVAYQESTAFETLLGYLFISDTKRCEQLLNWVDANLDPREVEEDKDMALDMALPSTSMDKLLRPFELCRINQMSAQDLAYIGDVIYELMVRSRHVWPTRKTSAMQLQVVALVRAEFQSALLKKFLKSFPLSPVETQMLSRGRNAFKATSQNQRAMITEFQDANALEALIGYLYMSDQNRCEDMLNWIDAHLDLIET